MRLLYFGPVPLASYWQRPHYFADFVARQPDSEVLWVDPYPTRLPRLADFVQRMSPASVAHAGIPGVAGCTVRALPIEPLPGASWANELVWRDAWAACRAFCEERPTLIGVARPSKLSVKALRSLPAVRRFADIMDDYPLFYRGLSRWSMARVERDVLGLVDTVICSAERLREKCAPLAGKQARTFVVPNAYDMSRLPSVRDCVERKAPDKIGFVGTMGPWFDWALIVEMARALPRQAIQLIGPVRSDVPALPGNVSLMPECTVDQAIEFCRGFSVGLIPFKLNALTESVDPIKYYELRALGVPVWSTAFGGMRARVNGCDAALIAPGVDWASLWARAGTARSSPEQIAGFREANDWRNRFDAVLGALTG